MIAATAPSLRAFQFERDTFAYAHELVWRYHFDEKGSMTVFKSDPPPTYYHRCFVMVRAARQFFYHARFKPELPPADTNTYQKLIRDVVARNVRKPCAEAERIVIPGFEGLRALSQAHAPLLKAACGAPWESYVLRSHWRMIFPTPLWYRKWMLKKIKDSLARRGLTLVHLFRFPHITINHGIALYGSTESNDKIEFEGYDPNIPEHPIHLIFDKQRQHFSFAANRYWGGGELKVFEIYADWPY
jgi:hypothetical protein